MVRICSVLSILITFYSLNAQTIRILESNSDHIKMELNYSGYFSIKEKVYLGKKFLFIDKNGVCFRNPGEPWIPSQYYNFGIPFNKIANCQIISLSQEKIPNVSVLSYPDSANQPIDRLKFDPAIYTSNRLFPASPINITHSFIMRYVKGASLEVAPYQYNPVTRELFYNKKMLIKINFEPDSHNQVNSIYVEDKLTEDFVASSFINPKEAKEFISRSVIVNSLNHSNVDTLRNNSQIVPANKLK